jgi:hypothetical protein
METMAASAPASNVQPWTKDVQRYVPTKVRDRGKFCSIQRLWRDHCFCKFWAVDFYVSVVLSKIALEQSHRSSLSTVWCLFPILYLKIEK